MKKNKMMRIASILLVVTLLSTCAISGTFAKYVTKAEGKAEARVAKWGILIGIEDADVFADKYATDDETYSGEFSVEITDDKESVVSEIEKLVAPGTKSVEGATATVFGTPEVAARYSLVISDMKDVVLPAGTYTDYTQLVQNDDGEYGYFETFKLDEDYAPVKWDIKVENEAGTYYLLSELAETYGLDVDGFAISEAVEIFKQYKTQLQDLLASMVTGASNPQIDVADDGTVTMSMDFDPNTEMDYTFTLTWSWAFENGKDEDKDGIFDFDPADTLLGNLMDASFEYVAAEGADTPEATLEVAASFTATAVQID